MFLYYICLIILIAIMKSAVLIDSKSEMNFFQKMKRLKAQRCSKLASILTRTSIKNCLFFWRRLTVVKLMHNRNLDIFILQKHERLRLKVLSSFKNHYFMRRNKFAKRRLSIHNYNRNLCRKMLENWKMLVNITKDKKQ